MECTHEIAEILFIPCENLGVDKNSYAQMPTPVWYGKHIRVYFSNRNSERKSKTHFADLDPNDMSKVMDYGISSIPLGPPGSFDDCGIMASSILNIHGNWFLYYVGWNQTLNVPYHLSIGLAKGSSNLSHLEKISVGPIIDRSILNPYFVTTPHVQFIDNKFEMYFSKGTGWLINEGNIESKYSVSRTESADGVNWSNFTEINLPNSNQTCIARPIKIENHLLYSRRPEVDFRTIGNGYRLVLSKSLDERNYTECKIRWASIEFANKDVSYAHPIEIASEMYIFFNGENFGKHGLYLAKVSGLK